MLKAANVHSPFGKVRLNSLHKFLPDPHFTALGEVSEPNIYCAGAKSQHSVSSNKLTQIALKKPFFFFAICKAGLSEESIQVNITKTLLC